MIGSGLTSIFLNSKKRAFTLVEFLLVLALTGIWTGTFLSLAWNLVEVSGVSERFQATQLELARASERLEFLIRSADSVETLGDTSFKLGVSGSSDTMDVSLRDGSLKIERGSEITQLTGSEVNISGISFSVYAYPSLATRYVSYEITGKSRFETDTFTVTIRGGAETRSVLE